MFDRETYRGVYKGKRGGYYARIELMRSAMGIERFNTITFDRRETPLEAARDRDLATLAFKQANANDRFNFPKTDYSQQEINVFRRKYYNFVDAHFYKRPITLPWIPAPRLANAI